MKKIILSLAIVIVTAMGANAQTKGSGGFRRAGTNAQTKAMQKQQIKADLNVTGDQAKNVDAIQQNYQLKMRAVKMDTQLTQADRKAKLSELQAQRKQELSAVISAQQIARLDGVTTIKKSKKANFVKKTHKVKKA